MLKKKLEKEQHRPTAYKILRHFSKVINWLDRNWFHFKSSLLLLLLDTTCTCDIVFQGNSLQSNSTFSLCYIPDNTIGGLQFIFTWVPLYCSAIDVWLGFLYWLYLIEILLFRPFFLVIGQRMLCNITSTYMYNARVLHEQRTYRSKKMQRSFSLPDEVKSEIICGWMDIHDRPILSNGSNMITITYFYQKNVTIQNEYNKINRSGYL